MLRDIFAAEFASWLIAMQNGFCDTRMANDFMAQMSGDAFGAIAPKQNLFLQVHDAHATGETIENAPTSLGIIK